MKTLSPLSRSHFNMLCVTGGMQPYLGLQSEFRAEQIGNLVKAGIRTGCLDAPCYTSTGHRTVADFSSHTEPVESVTIIEGRLA